MSAAERALAAPEAADFSDEELVALAPQLFLPRLIEEVIGSETTGESALVRLACADDDVQGQELDIYRE